jgi:outer membrane protein
MVTGWLLSLALSGPAAPLTASEAAALAARESPAVHAAAARASRADAALRGARSLLGPTLSLDAGFVSTDDPVDVFALTLKQQRFSAQNFFAGDPNEPAFLRDWSAGVSAGWSADVSGAARASVRAAGATRDAASLDATRARDEAALEAIAAFLSARRGQEMREVLSAREADAARDVELARSLFEGGAVTAADPARARAALAEAAAQRIAAESLERSGRAALSRWIGDANAARPLAAIPPVPETASEPAAPAVRADVAGAELAGAAARDSEAAARRQGWPALTLRARYERHAPQPGGRWGDSATISAGLRVPIFASGAVSARIAEAAATSLETAAAARDRRGRAGEEAERARGELAAARGRVLAFAEQESAAREAREVQQARYGEGAARLTDLLEARAAETSARLGALASRAELALAWSNLRFALGLPVAEEENR